MKQWLIHGVLQPVLMACWLMTLAPTTSHAAEAESKNTGGLGDWVRKIMSSSSKTDFEKKRADATTGNATAQGDFAYLLLESSNYVEAVKWFTKAAQQGDVYSQFSLGRCYCFAQGTTTNYAEAASWWRKAAEQGDTESQYGLGLLYESGLGVPKSQIEAAKWYRKAAYQGNPRAQNALALCFRDGIGDVPRDLVDAYYWANLSAAGGDEFGKRHRDELERHMSTEDLKRVQQRALAFKAGPVPDVVAEKDSAYWAKKSTPVKLWTYTGTGFFITDDGYLLTAFHFLLRTNYIEVKYGKTTSPAEVIILDRTNDLAILKIARASKSIPLETIGSRKLGESVFTVGYPNILIQGVEPKLTKGEISSLSGAFDDPTYYQISVPIQPGNSGGPLVNQYGNAVGIVAAKLSEKLAAEFTGALPQNVSYAVKSSNASTMIESVPHLKEKLKRPNPSNERRFEDVVSQTQEAVALVIVH